MAENSPRLTGMGSRDRNDNNRPQTLPSLSSFLPPSLSSRQADGRCSTTAFPLFTVATEKKTRISSLTVVGFEGHLKNTTSQSRESFVFSSCQGTGVIPLSLCPSQTPSHFSHTTAKSIEMTTQLEGHSQAAWWNARRFAAQKTSGKTNTRPASTPACPSSSG